MAGFLSDPEIGPTAERHFAADRDELGFVMNVSRLWAYEPDVLADLFGLLGACRQSGDFDHRQLGILVTAAASTLGDSYCSLAWGAKLAKSADANTAAAVVRGDDHGLAEADAAMAAWARKVVADPNSTTEADVERLRAVGFDDAQIFAMTVIAALRLAFSSVNDALGATPDHQLRARTPEAVLAAVGFGRPIDPAPADEATN